MSSSNIQGVALFSGGLDSCLAIKLVAVQGISVIALYFDTPFCALPKTGRSVDLSSHASSHTQVLKERAEQAGGKLEVITVGREYVDMVASPEHGYGSNMNPCIDCKIFFYRRAYDIMQESGSHFIITGEVL